MFSCKNSTIAIIDSGIGGVSVLRQIIDKHKSGNYIYFADNLHMPYGNKSQKFLRLRLKAIIENLKQKYHVDYLIVACNTASSVLNKDEYPNLFTMHFEDKHTYLATSLTKKSLSSMKVIDMGSLAKKIENNISNEKKLDALIKRYVVKHQLNTLDNFVLGCTHYELVKELFKKYCPNSNIISNSSFVLKDLNFKTLENEINIVVLLSKQSKHLEDKILKLIRG